MTTPIDKGEKPEQDYCFQCGAPLDELQGIYCSVECELKDQDDGFDDDDSEFEDGEDFDECGMMADGSCSMIGSEYCDWECKHSRRTLWKK